MGSITLRHNATVTCQVSPRVRARFGVRCELCGSVGQPQEIAEDAQAIADRHNEIQGFERRART